MTIDQVFDLLAIAEDDRVECSRLLAGDADQAAVAEARSALTHRLGSYSEEPLGAATTDPMAWLTAFLQLTPMIVEWHRGLGVSAEVTCATLADVGRNIAGNVGHKVGIADAEVVVRVVVLVVVGLRIVGLLFLKASTSNLVEHSLPVDCSNRSL